MKEEKKEQKSKGNFRKKFRNFEIKRKNHPHKQFSAKIGQKDLQIFKRFRTKLKKIEKFITELAII